MSEDQRPYLTAGGLVKMTAKRAGSCDRCHYPIAIGSTIKWRKATRNVRTGAFIPAETYHDVCPVQR